MKTEFAKRMKGEEEGNKLYEKAPVSVDIMFEIHYNVRFATRHILLNTVKIKQKFTDILIRRR